MLGMGFGVPGTQGGEGLRFSDDTAIPARGSAPSASGLSVQLLYLLSFLSGAAALLYQVSWSRMLALAFGSSLLSVSAVVAGFGAFEFGVPQPPPPPPVRGCAML